jgi:papain like cysteine protease AvrRpt2
MKINKKFFCLIGLSVFGFGPPLSCRADDADLQISPVFQQSPVWCWLAVGQMVFQYYDVPPANAVSYQCGIIAAFGGPTSPCWYNCQFCQVGGGSDANVCRMFQLYPQQIAFLLRIPPVPLVATPRYSALSKDAVKEQLDNDRPVVVGINPNGFAFPGVSEHVALIVGYSEDSDGNLTLKVNDPWPYDLPQFPQPNPYVAAGGDDNNDGSFSINYNDFKSGLRWNTTILVRKL